MIRQSILRERERCAAIVRRTIGYYPPDIFREIEVADTAPVHQAFPGMCDRISAAMARFTARNILQAIEHPEVEE